MAGNKADDLAKIAALSVTTTGHAPSSVSWDFAKEELEENILTLMKSTVKSIQQVTIEPTHNYSAAMGFAWLPSNCDDLIDNEMRNVIGKPVSKYSKDITELLEKYAPKDNKKVIPGQKGSNLSAVPLDLKRVLSVLMDERGIYAQQEYGYSVKAHLELNAIFRENRDNGKVLTAIRVTKSTNTHRLQRPKVNQNFRF